MSHTEPSAGREPESSAEASHVPDTDRPSAPRTAERFADPAESFVNGLADVGFTRFVSLRIMKMVYMLTLVVTTLAALGLFVVLARMGWPGLLFGLVAAPMLWMFLTAMVRLTLEAFAMLFRINDNLVLLAARSATPASSGQHPGQGH
jgi:Domain of unknown function (DUF4282)